MLFFAFKKKLDPSAARGSSFTARRARLQTVEERLGGTTEANAAPPALLTA
jgi:hypothetical protein